MMFYDVDDSIQYTLLELLKEWLFKLLLNIAVYYR